MITGDLIDKGSDSLGVIALMRKLQSDAASRGGQVIISMGNHEAEFLAEPTGRKTRDFAAELKETGLDPTDVANCNGDLGQFLCNLPIAVRVNNWFFSHGGNTKNRTIPELSAAIEAGFDKDGFASTELIGHNSILEARLNKKGPHGLPWFYFMAGFGTDGYLVNVRSAMKRIRKKFLALDPSFAEIENFAAVGYAWRTPAGDGPCVVMPPVGVEARGASGQD